MVAWQEGHGLVLMIYKITESFPKNESYGLTNQIRRAAVSVTSNLAEGFTRRTSKEKLQFFKISQGSLVEIQNQLLIARDVKYLDVARYAELSEQAILVYKLLNGLLKATRLRKYE